MVTDSILTVPKLHRILVPSVCSVCAMLLGLGSAAPGAAQTLERHAFSSGAVDASGGGVRLRGTLGEAGFVGQCQNAALRMGEGFWSRAYFSIASDAPLPQPDRIPLVNELSQSFPNPFERETTIAFGVARPSPVRLSLFDVAGRRITTLVDDELPAGRYDFRWTGLDDSGRRVSSGVYFYRLDVGAWSQTKRMLKLQ